MDSGDNRGSVICNLCGAAYILPEDEAEGNLPRVLICGHIFCTKCLCSLELDSVITCPECKVESPLPEGGVLGLQEDSRIIGCIYTARMNKMRSCRSNRGRHRRKNKLLLFSEDCATAEEEEQEQPVDIEKMEKAVDEALAQAAENIARLDHIHQTLVTGLSVQMKKDRARLVMEIDKAVDRATHILHQRKETLLSELANMEANFSSSKKEVCRIQDRMKALELAMQMAREVRRVPSLEQYCTLDKVLETLQAPVDPQSFDMKCITLGSGLSCDFQSENLSQSLTACLKIKAGRREPLSQQVGSSRKPAWCRGEHRSGSRTPPGRSRASAAQQQNQEALRTGRPLRRSSPSPRRQHRVRFSHRSPASDPGAPDVIIEEVIDEEQQQDSALVGGRGDFKALPPTGPELANDKWRTHTRKKHQVNAANIQQGKVINWVLVTHVVNPSHFYIRYVAEKKEGMMLSKRINLLCCEEKSLFTPEDTLETGSMVFAKWKPRFWCRASVIEVFQSDSMMPVDACKVTQLARIRVFFLDYGFIKGITLQRTGTTECVMENVNEHVRRVDVALQAELSLWAPQAVKCSLKDLVPSDPTKGWSKEAQVEFQRMVGSAAVKMELFCEDGDCLLVDLKKASTECATHLPISIREYLVFIEVAKFYAPVTPGRKLLLYYPPVYPKVNTEINAVVSHINNPADFYIKLVENMEFMLLTAKLQDCYNATTVGGGDDDLNLYCPVIGQACIARFDGKVWYRAQVLGHPGGRMVEVRSVDFGGKKILSVNDLRKIKDEFFALPAMAIQCCLSDVVPVDGQSWTDACTDRFISLVHHKLVTVVATEMVPKSKPLPVQLFESGLDGPLANMAEVLVTEELARFKPGRHPRDAEPPVDDSPVWDPPLEDVYPSEAKSCPGGGASDQKTPAGQELLDFQPQLRLPACLKDLKVRVTHVRSPGSFYIRLTQSDSHLIRLCELLKQQCAGTKPQDVDWKAGMFCAALANGVWERVRIISISTSSSIAEVLRCDFGNTAKLHVSNLRPLQASLEGSLTLECTLSDIRPAGGRSTWTATACDFISYYLTGASAVMTIKELTDERPVPVVLSCSNKVGRYVSIADFLVSEGLALPKRKPREEVVSKPEESDAESQVSEEQTDGPDMDDKPTPPPPPSPPPSPPPPPPVSPPVSSPPPPARPAPAPRSTPSSTSTSAPPKPAPRTHVSAEMVKTQLYHPPELPCHGHIQVTISAIGEDGLIYARTNHADCQLDQLRERIQQSMKTLPRQKPYTWKSVLGCAVIGPDMLWYRGQLLEVLGGTVKVRYLDYGLVENIPVVHVYPMLLCEDVPQLCMPCHLHGVNPVGGQWQQDAVALLKELLLSRHVDMHVMELPMEPRGSLTVDVSLDGIMLSRILCHHQHASRDQSASTQEGNMLTPPVTLLDYWDIDIKGLSPEGPMLGPFMYPSLPEEGQQFQVRVKHLWTPNELFLWPLVETAEVEVDGETLDKVLTRINENVCDLPRLTNFPPDGPCLAKYSDGKYYRAKLLDFTKMNPTMILVQHVDFGSHDTLPPSKLRQMPAELLRFPVQALKVRVAGFKPPSHSQDREVLPYSPKWSVKALMYTMDLLHGSITASIVAREPQLTVLLYDEEGALVHLPLVSSGLAELD